MLLLLCGKLCNDAVESKTTKACSVSHIVLGSKLVYLINYWPDCDSSVFVNCSALRATTKEQLNPMKCPKNVNEAT